MVKRAVARCAVRRRTRGVVPRDVCGALRGRYRPGFRRPAWAFCVDRASRTTWEYSRPTHATSSAARRRDQASLRGEPRPYVRGDAWTMRHRQRRRQNAAVSRATCSAPWSRQTGEDLCWELTSASVVSAAASLSPYASTPTDEIAPWAKRAECAQANTRPRGCFVRSRRHGPWMGA